MRLVLAGLLALAVLAGCDSTKPPRPEAQADTGPAASPPATEAGGPPPAWIETPGGSAWLAYGSYCWDGVCLDALQVSCDDASVPQVAVGRTQIVRFHLAFTPTEATLFSADRRTGPLDPVALDPAETIEWTVDRFGATSLQLRAGRSRDVSYTACLVDAPPG